MNTQNTGWSWWAGHNKEWMVCGPHATREDAVREATDTCLGEFQDDGAWKLSFYVYEAEQAPLRLADWVGADRAIERAYEELSHSDRVECDRDDGPWFECTLEQERDLAERIQRACDEWQSAHGLVFTCSTFSAIRSAQTVVVPHPGDGAV